MSDIRKKRYSIIENAKRSKVAFQSVYQANHKLFKWGHLNKGHLRIGLPSQKV